MLVGRTSSTVLGTCCWVLIAACDGVQLPDYLAKEPASSKSSEISQPVLAPAENVMTGAGGQSYLNLDVRESSVVRGHKVELVAVRRVKGKLTAMVDVTPKGESSQRHRLHTGEQFLVGDQAATVVLVTLEKLSAELGSGS